MWGGGGGGWRLKLIIAVIKDFVRAMERLWRKTKATEQSTY